MLFLVGALFVALGIYIMCASISGAMSYFKNDNKSAKSEAALKKDTTWAQLPEKDENVIASDDTCKISEDVKDVKATEKVVDDKSGYDGVKMLSQEYTKNPETDLIGIGGDENNITLNYPTNDMYVSERGTKRLVRFLNRYGKDAKYLIESYTDSSGEYDFNKRLARDRAEVVRSLMLEWGVGQENIKIVAHGEDNPKYPNDTAENRAKNRRVEITAHKTGE
jgi:outer membrane protein OmpA-like peptidoglycan-associated protein